MVFNRESDEPKDDARILNCVFADSTPVLDATPVRSVMQRPTSGLDLQFNGGRR